jgi:hypothetical protein
LQPPTRSHAVADRSQSLASAPFARNGDERLEQGAADLGFVKSEPRERERLPAQDSVPVAWRRAKHGFRGTSKGPGDVSIGVLGVR